MKQLKIIILFLTFITGFGMNAQQKLQKISKSVNVDKDVTLKLNTNYTNIEVETWNKNEIEVEAYIESEELSKEDLQKILKNWDVEIEGSGDYVTISTGGDIHVLYDDEFLTLNFDFDF